MTPESILFTVVAAVGSYLIRHVNLFGHSEPSTNPAPAVASNTPVLTGLEKLLLALLQQTSTGGASTATPPTSIVLPPK